MKYSLLFRSTIFRRIVKWLLHPYASFLTDVASYDEYFPPNLLFVNSNIRLLMSYSVF